MSNWFGFSISVGAPGQRTASFARSGLILPFTLAILLLPQSGFAETFHTLKGLLSQHFAEAQKVSFRRVELDPAQMQVVQERLRSPLSKHQWTFYRAERSGMPVGYALFDSEKGQHELMDVATFFDAKGKVTRVELMSFREPYGDGVKSERFRQQFIGKDARSGFVAGRDIDTISGATLSSRAMAKAVQRAAVLLDLGLAGGSIETNAPVAAVP